MSKSSEVRSFDYVNHPYAAVRDALRSDAAGVFHAATRAAAARAHSLASQLHVHLGSLEVSADIDLTVDTIEESATGPGGAPITRLKLRWQAASRPRLFPLMNAELSLYPLTGSETQLDFAGRYDPPLGMVGSAIDAVAGRRIAEASVHRFVTDVAAHLRDKLAS